MTEIDARGAAIVARRVARGRGFHASASLNFAYGAKWAVERLPSRDEIGVKLKTDTRLCYPDGAPVDWSKLGDAVLALIREAYEQSR